MTDGQNQISILVVNPRFKTDTQFNFVTEIEILYEFKIIKSLMQLNIFKKFHPDHSR